MSLERRMMREGRNRKQLRRALEANRRRFVAKFGREPGPGDPLIFDEDADTPRPMTVDAFNRKMVTAMITAGIRGELIHAYQKTGMIVTEDNADLFSTADLQSYRAAIDEYFDLQEGRKQ